MPTVELPPAPAADAVMFRLRCSRVWLATALVVLPAVLLVRGGFMVLAARLGAPPDVSAHVDTAVIAVITMVSGGAGAVIGVRHQPGWVRSSAAGLEFAASGRVPVYLPWPQVRSVAFRRHGPYTELVITPVDIAAAGYARGPGRAPRMRRRNGERTFVVEAGLMTPGPAAMAAELNRRRPD